MTSLLELVEYLARPSRILIVDDEPGLIVVMLAHFSRYDCLVDSTATVQEAMALIMANSYDLIFVDLKLGVESGIDVIKFVHAKKLSVPVVAMTGFLTDPAVNEAFNSGIVAFLRKPYDFTEERMTQVLKLFKVKLRAVHAVPIPTLADQMAVA